MNLDVMITIQDGVVSANVSTAHNIPVHLMPGIVKAIGDCVRELNKTINPVIDNESADD